MVLCTDVLNVIDLLVRNLLPKDLNNSEKVLCISVLSDANYKKVETTIVSRQINLILYRNHRKNILAMSGIDKEINYGFNHDSSFIKLGGLVSKYQNDITEELTKVKNEMIEEMVKSGAPEGPDFIYKWYNVIDEAFVVSGKLVPNKDKLSFNLIVDTEKNREIDKIDLDNENLTPNQNDVKVDEIKFCEECVFFNTHWFCESPNAERIGYTLITKNNFPRCSSERCEGFCGKSGKNWVKKTKKKRKK